MKILISNDDGIHSPGIHALAAMARTLGEVTVVAPDRERSTSGHSLTLHKPLRVHAHGDGVYSTSGSPPDCIYLGLREILKSKPDLILSGINCGANLGTDVHYSGTVAAAREGALMNIRSYAISMVDMRQITPGHAKEDMRFEMGASVAKEVILATREIPFPAHTFLNVNIPNRPRDELQAIQVARQGFRFYSNEAIKRTDPRGKDYFWIGGSYLGFENSEASDCQAAQNLAVTVTPLTIDCTHNEFYATLRGIWKS